MTFVAKAALPVVLCGESFILLGARALYRPRQASLLVADLHLGKEGALRTAQVFVPEGPTRETLFRLDYCLHTVAAEKLIILGDLFHNRHALDTLGREFRQWRRSWPNLQIILVPGSHDRWTGIIPDDLEVTLAPDILRRPPFVYRHYPEPVEGSYTLCGHIHPGVSLHGPGEESLRLSCFCFGPRIGILPAFGEFTGTVPIDLKEQDGVYAVADNYVIPVKPFSD